MAWLSRAGKKLGGIALAVIFTLGAVVWYISPWETQAASAHTTVQSAPVQQEVTCWELANLQPTVTNTGYILAEMEKVPVFLVVPITATLIRLILNTKTSEEVRLHFMNSPWFSRICRDERVKQAVDYKVEKRYKRDQMV